MRRGLAVAAIALVGAVGGADLAAADPLQAPKTFEFALTCDGLGHVLATNISQAHNEAIHVLGTNTIILLGFDPAVPGIQSRALAAGTICTLTAAGPPGALEPEVPPFVFPAVIVNG